MKKKPFGQTTIGRIVKGLVGTAVPAIAPLLQGKETSISMEAERAALTEMESKIKSNGTDKKTRAPRGVK